MPIGQGAGDRAWHSRGVPTSIRTRVNAHGERLWWMPMCRPMGSGALATVYLGMGVRTSLLIMCMLLLLVVIHVVC